MKVYKRNIIVSILFIILLISNLISFGSCENVERKTKPKNSESASITESDTSYSTKTVPVITVTAENVVSDDPIKKSIKNGTVDSTYELLNVTEAITVNGSDSFIYITENLDFFNGLMDAKKITDTELPLFEYDLPEKYFGRYENKDEGKKSIYYANVSSFVKKHYGNDESVRYYIDPKLTLAETSANEKGNYLSFRSGKEGISVYYSSDFSLLSFHEASASIKNNEYVKLFMTRLGISEPVYYVMNYYTADLQENFYPHTTVKIINKADSPEKTYRSLVLSSVITEMSRSLLGIKEKNQTYSKAFKSEFDAEIISYSDAADKIIANASEDQFSPVKSISKESIVGCIIEPVDVSVDSLSRIFRVPYYTFYINMDICEKSEIIDYPIAPSPANHITAFTVSVCAVKDMQEVISEYCANNP